MNILMPLLTQRHGTRELRVDSQLVVNWHITSDGPRSCPLEVGHNPKEVHPELRAALFYGF